MILDDKKRVIGKIVSINSDRFTVELLSGVKNFNISGYDDIHYFAQINSYVIVPYQNHYVVSEVVGVREKDALDFSNVKEQELNKARSIKHLDVLPIGTLRAGKFDFGVSVYPTLYSDVLYIKDEELDALFNVRETEVPKCNDCERGKKNCGSHNDSWEGKTRLKTIDVGESAIFPDYTVKIDINKFFGGHAAVLGNTGSGKSCTIASMLQTIYCKEKEFFAIGSTFIIFDVNGEYKHAFSELKNSDVKVTNFSLVTKDGCQPLKLPHYFLNIDEWELLLQASEKTQRPVLRTALGLATLFSGNDDVKITRAKNHVLATCLTSIMRDETSSPSKKDRLIAILRRFNTTEISLTQVISSEETITIGDVLIIHFGELKRSELLLTYLESMLVEDFEMPNYIRDTRFSFEKIEDALDLAILYEEAYGNRHIRDYCSSLITRFKSIKERSDFGFLRQEITEEKDVYLAGLFGLDSGNKKIAQIIILDVDSVEDEMVELVSAVLTRMLFEQLKIVESRNTFPVNLILEEAHRYISERQPQYVISASKVFERVAKEGRKYGLFLLISSQRPSELSKTVLSQCNNFIVHRIQNPDDLSHIRQITPHISEATLKKLPSIPTQHALIFGNAVNIPTLYKVKNADPRPLSDNNDVSDNWFVDKDTTFSVFLKKTKETPNEEIN